MEIETLKAAWQDYDRLLQTTPELSKEALHSLIRERSRSRIAQIKTEYGVTCVFSFLLILFFGAVIGGNPFDFHYRIQFLPAILIMGWTLVFIIILLRGYREVNISIHADNLILSLKKVIAAYTRSQALVHRVAVPVLFSGFFFPVSFLPKHIYESGLTSGALIAVAHIVLNVLLYFAAKRFGFFKSSTQAGLQRDLEQLEQLKSLAGEENEFE